MADHVGLFEAAAGGTLLLDEIGEMLAPLQTKMLRVLQDRHARPVGARRSVNFDPIDLCEQHGSACRNDAPRVRQDLYFRINTISLTVPSLRRRPEDIPLLASNFLAHFAEQYGRPSLALHEAAREALLRHQWRGNVRELEHAIERAVIVARGTRLRVEHLPESVHASRRMAVPDGMPPIMALAELERLALMCTLEHTRGNKRAAAAILGVYRPTLQQAQKVRHLWCRRWRRSVGRSSWVAVAVPLHYFPASFINGRKHRDGSRAPDSSVYTGITAMQGFQTPKGTVPAARVRDLVGLIRSEYDEMPGLSLTRAQVQRLWLLEPAACDNVLHVLVDAGYLRLTPGGYVRG